MAISWADRVFCITPPKPLVGVRFSHPLVKKSWKSSIYQGFQLFWLWGIVKVITQVITLNNTQGRSGDEGTGKSYKTIIRERRKAVILSKSGAGRLIKMFSSSLPSATWKKPKFLVFIRGFGFFAAEIRKPSVESSEGPPEWSDST